MKVGCCSCEARRQAQRNAQPRRATDVQHAARRSTGVGWRVSFAFSEPRRGGTIIAPGKAVEAAARGKTPPHPSLFFSFWFGAPQAPNQKEKKRRTFCVRHRSALRLPRGSI